MHRPTTPRATPRFVAQQHQLPQRHRGRGLYEDRSISGRRGDGLQQRHDGPNGMIRRSALTGTVTINSNLYDGASSWSWNGRTSRASPPGARARVKIRPLKPQARYRNAAALDFCPRPARADGSTPETTPNARARSRAPTARRGGVRSNSRPVPTPFRPRRRRICIATATKTRRPGSHRRTAPSSGI